MKPAGLHLLEPAQLAQVNAAADGPAPSLPLHILQDRPQPEPWVWILPR